MAIRYPDAPINIPELVLVINQVLTADCIAIKLKSWRSAHIVSPNSLYGTLYDPEGPRTLPLT